VLRKWQTATKHKEPNAAGTNSQRLALQDQVIRLQEENDALRAGQGSGFLPSTKAEDLAERIAEHHKPSYLRRLANKLMEVAEREERQDRIEAGAQRQKRKADA
jgi:hypothetical protein